MMSTSQQESLRSEGVTRHVWERYPLSGHAVRFSTRAWEIGRMTRYVRNYSSTEEKITFQEQFATYGNIGWMRETPRALEAQDDTPEYLERQLVEKEEFMKDEGELRMFSWFTDGSEALYTGMIEKFVRNTPALWEDFAMRTSTGEMYLVDPDPFTTAAPTEPTVLP